MRTVAEFEATVFVSAGLAGMTGAEDFEAGSGSLVWLWANVGGGGALVAESLDRPKPVLALGVGATQVWSLTQFYSVDFSQSRIGVIKKCVFNKRLIKVCVSC